MLLAIYFIWLSKLLNKITHTHARTRKMPEEWRLALCYLYKIIKDIQIYSNYCEIKVYEHNENFGRE